MAWLGTGLGPPARAATAVRIAATDPAGDVVTLGRNQNFYLLLDYQTDRPVRIWARPYYRGGEVAAGSNPSGERAGSGQALGWFFLMQPGDRVDEVRITAGDGTRDGTTLVATYPVQIEAGGQPASAHAAPEWVDRLTQVERAEQRAAREARAQAPVTARDSALVSGFMLLMLALGVAGIAMPAWALYRWRGGWRLLAALPAGAMAFVLLRLLVDTGRDPTSHNLWPFEIVMTGGACAGAMLLLLLLRRGVGRR